MPPSVSKYGGFKDYQSFERKIKEFIDQSFRSRPGKIEQLTVTLRSDSEFDVNWTQGGKQHARLHLPDDDELSHFNKYGEILRLSNKAAVLQMYKQAQKNLGPEKTLPIPQIVSFDLRFVDVSNTLNSPYILFTHAAPKRTINWLEREAEEKAKEKNKAKPDIFTHQERLDLAQRLGELYSNLLKCTVDDQDGQPRLGQTNDSEELEYVPVSPHDRKKEDHLWKDASPTGRLLYHSFKGWEERFSKERADLKLKPVRILAERYEKACKLVEEMDTVGHFKDVKFIPVDLGLGPGRISFDTGRKEIEFTPSGNAILAPDFMACRPPVWLWKRLDNWITGAEWEFKDNCFDPEPAANDDAMKKVKKTFEETAGKEFTSKAFGDLWRFARQLAWLALTQPDEIGIREDYQYHKEKPEEIERMNHLISQWENSLRKNYGLKDKQDNKGEK